MTSPLKSKHPFWIRLTHWVNLPLMIIMIWSGVLIYWANNIYWPPLPDSFYEGLHLDHKLAEGMAFHFFFMWFFALNGFFYFIYLMVSGNWRFLLPGWQGSGEAAGESPKYNRLQALTYLAINLMGFGAILTGLAIYKPVQLAGFKNFLGGYETARLLHYLLAVGFILFFFVHVTKVAMAGWNNFQSMVTGRENREHDDRQSRQHKPIWSFAALFAGIAIFIGFFAWIQTRDEIYGLPWPLRKSLEINDQIAQKLLSPTHLDRPRKNGANGNRINGDLGLDAEPDLAHWKMQVITPVGGGNHSTSPLEMSLDEIKALPKTTIVTQFKCIEGWSEDMAFAGVKFSDFLEHYHLGTHSGAAVSPENKSDLYGHVGLETPDGQYYVSVDILSMLTPDTLLAYEMNGFPLTVAHGAPLRLIIPNKYGVKSLKRVGKIIFSDEKLPDYWSEQGYDWFIGL